jgi:hypothetical protein
VLLALIPGVQQRFQELTTLCPDTGSFSGGGSFSFNFGPTPPPGYVLPTPPPEAFFTPPPGGFATPPPGAFVFPPGPGGRVAEVLGMVVTILVGVGAAVGVATITGIAGTASHARSSQKR